jgi:hypothetical protein
MCTDVMSLLKHSVNLFQLKKMTDIVIGEAASFVFFAAIWNEFETEDTS